ncbi:hypothetical protein RUM43_005423 [Polyplax serrata]|uniref:Uncharacterized protein n=1 Tax=Polyplax serrata TaxID=468196 RepID=A0AAN8NW10_POLSC
MAEKSLCNGGGMPINVYAAIKRDLDELVKTLVMGGSGRISEDQSERQELKVHLLADENDGKSQEGGTRKRGRRITKCIHFTTLRIVEITKLKSS